MPLSAFQLQEINGTVRAAWSPDGSQLALAFDKRREFEIWPV